MPTPRDGFYPHEKGLKGQPGAPVATRTKRKRFVVSRQIPGVHLSEEYFAAKPRALAAIARCTVPCTLLDRRTGMYLDPTTGEQMPADQQLTDGGR